MAVFTSIASAVQAVAAWSINVAGVSIAVGNFILQSAVSLGTSALAKALAGDDPDVGNFTVKGKVRAGGLVPRSFIVGPGGTAGSLS